MADFEDLARTNPARAVDEMTIAEMAALTAGRDVWTVPGVERLGLPALRMTDGPNGARGGTFGNGSRAICMPCGSALGATFDPALLEAVGGVLGREARQKRSRVLLAPTINLPRSPRFGRAFECYSEDPHLAGRLAAAFVTGVQAQGVATTPKHLVGNETEFERQTIDSRIDDRTLREIYLLPFEWTIRHGGSLGVMTAYNRLNGSWCAIDGDLLNGILRDDWGFEGFVVTDWFAAGDTVGSLEAGLDVQMPGPDRFFGGAVAKAVENGEVDQAHLRKIAERRINVHHRLDAWTDDTEDDESAIEHEADRAIARRAAAESMVLLKNEADLLPLDPDVTSVALIGPNAMTAHIMGGGSAQLRPHRRVTPEAAFRARLGDRVTVEPGCVIDKLAPPLRPTGGFEIEFHATSDLRGDVVATDSVRRGRVIWAGEPAPGIGLDRFSARLTGELLVDTTGVHTFTLIQAGAARVSFGDEIVIDGIAERPPLGDAFFGMGSIELSIERELQAGDRIPITIEFIADEGTGIRGIFLGHRTPVPEDLFENAVSAAATADVALVMVGTTHEWETEGEDRESLDLPGRQAELIDAVVAVNPRTAVLVNTGAPVSMPWAEQAPAVLQTWLGGQEMAEALVDVVFGECEPAGRLPVTVPACDEHTSAFGSFPGEHNATEYRDGTIVGWRHHDTRGLAPSFAFGHGGSYTTWTWQAPSLTTLAENHVRLDVPVRNTGGRTGAQVVQVYGVRPADAPLGPRRVLLGFAKVHVAAGETTSAIIEIRPRAFASWTPASISHRELYDQMRSGVIDIDISGATEPGWDLAVGTWTLEIARSSAPTAVEHRLELDVVADAPRLSPSELP